jgi:nitrogenase molybdenum-iron protein beta chain
VDTIQLVDEQHAAREPAWSCGLSGAFVGALGFEDSSLLVHGSSGCGFAMRYGLSPHWKSFIPCPVTSLQEDGVIFGGREQLESGIARVEAVNQSDVLFLLTACAAEIIGEDVQAAAAKASRQFEKPVVAVDSGGATGNTVDGYNNFILRTVETLYPPAVKGERTPRTPGQKPRIDVTGIIPYYDMFWRGDIGEIRRVFGTVGVELNSVLSGAVSLTTLARANETDLTVTLNKHVGVRALHRIKRRGGPIHVARVAPIGIELTTALVEDVLSALGLATDERLGALRAEAETAREIMLRGFDFSKVMITSGRAAIIGESSRAIALTNFLLNELGMRSTLVALTNRPDEGELELLERILKKRGNRARVLVDQDGETVRRQLVETRPNIVFGRSTDRVVELPKTAFITWQFPATDRFVVYDRPYLGYKGVASIVDDVINAFSRLWY